MGDSVRVDPDALRDYGREVYTKGQMMTIDVTRSLGNVTALLQSLTTPTDAGSFAEGAVIAGILMQHVSDFSAFATDLTNGLRDIGSAAAVIATAYRNGDVRSAQDIGVIDFAFGDPNSTKPRGLTGHDTTFLEEEAARAAAQGQQSMAALGMDDYVTTSVNVGYMTIYFYEDGSQKIAGSRSSTVPGISGTTSTIQIVDPNGTTTRTRSVTTGTNAEGLDTTVTSEEQGEGTVTTVTTNNADGSVTVATTVPGPEGPTTTTITTHPHTSSGDDQGPVQQAEEQYGLQELGW